MTDDKPKSRATRRTVPRKARQSRAASAKKAVTKKAGAKTGRAKPIVKPVAKPAASRKGIARKSVPTKTARIRKRVPLPPLPPPGPTAITTRGRARRPVRVKLRGLAKAESNAAAALYELPACTELALRQKLRLAAPYLELWLTQADRSRAETDSLTPEAAFVRIWQWLMLQATLEGGEVVITADLIEKLFAEEMGRVLRA